MNICFDNILLVSPEDNREERVYLWLKDGKINHCSPEQPTLDTDTERENGEALVCFPGFFDMHVHLREPGQEYKETIRTGTDAAANGGFTGVLCMPNTAPAIDSVPIVEYILNRAKDTLTEVYCSAAITKGRKGTELAPLLELNDAGVVMFTDDGSCVMNSEVMRRAFDYTAPFDALLSQHCEDHALTEGFAMNEGAVSTKLGLKGYPTVAEEIMINRDIQLAEYCGNRRYHVSHMSTQGGVRIVREAKQRGARVTCEVTPHHFVLTDEAVGEYDTHAKMNPPLRRPEDITAIIEGLKDGTVDCIATDHAPHAPHEKEVEFASAANGITGLESSIGLSLTHLYHTGHVSLKRIAELMSVNPRTILNLPSISIREGEVANLTIVAPDEEWVFDINRSRSKSKNCPFGGVALKGKPRYAINRDQIHKCDL
jgi:dihydroorotase